MEPFYIPEDALPPQDVRLTDVHIEPWPDGRRIRVHISLTPFRSPPNLQAVISAADGREIASAFIVESIQHRLVFTMHVREPAPQTTYVLTVKLSYLDLGDLDERRVEFQLAESKGDV